MLVFSAVVAVTLQVSQASVDNAVEGLILFLTVLRKIYNGIMRLKDLND